MTVSVLWLDGDAKHVWLILHSPMHASCLAAAVTAEQVRSAGDVIELPGIPGRSSQALVPTSYWTEFFVSTAQQDAAPQAYCTLL